MQYTGLDNVIQDYAEFRDHIAEAIHAEFELRVSPAFGLVLVKSFGYCFNTFKAIGLVLPELYYEQANALLRILWEAAANLAWVSVDQGARSKLFAQFTVVERRKFIQMRVNEAQRLGPPEAVVRFEAELRAFDDAFGSVLADYQYEDSKRRKKFRQRFSSPTLDAIIRDIGEPWLTEYRERYPLWCFYAHASPGAVLFPNPFLNEVTKEAFDAYDKPRTFQVALWSLAVMERVYFIACGIIGKDDREYFDKLNDRIGFRVSLHHPDIKTA